MLAKASPVKRRFIQRSIITKKKKSYEYKINK